MPIIKPISDLRNNFNEISKICHEDAEPVFITKNGTGDLVVMSITKYEQLEAKFDLLLKLRSAELDELNGVPMISHEEVFRKLRQRFIKD